MNNDIYEDLSYLDNDYELAISLQKNLISIARGEDYDSRNYQVIRQELLQNDSLKHLVPEYIKHCRDIKQFWQFIKEKISGTGSYAKRSMFITESFHELLGYLEEIHVLSDKKSVGLYKKEKIKTIDEELDDLIHEARERFDNPKDKQVALEKLWDAFERIKTHFGSNKKTSSATLVDMISTDFDKDFIEKEFKELTNIGNGYRIRHHEQGKTPIKDKKHIEYLFLRMLALLNLCLENIKLQESGGSINE